jgi:hypothetical protein
MVDFCGTPRSGLGSFCKQLGTYKYLGVGRSVLRRNLKHCLDFSFVFSAPLPVWRNLFSATGIFWGGRYQPVLGSSDQRTVLANLLLFLKSKKISALLYLGKGPGTGPSMIFDMFPWPTGLGHRSQITEGPSAIPQTLMTHFSTPVSNESISHLERVQWSKTVLVRWKKHMFQCWKHVSGMWNKSHDENVM